MKLPLLPSSTNQGEEVQILATSIPSQKKKTEVSGRGLPHSYSSETSSRDAWGGSWKP
jgi:hypothetical protein